MITAYYCPKCKSEDIVVVRLSEERKHKVSMDDAWKPNHPPLTAYKYDFRATCRGCGYEVEFQI